MSSAVTREDERWMAHALALAARGRGLTSPNPMVGAVVVRDRRPVGEGHHARAGAPHAEVLALAEAGAAARAATLYVTLEPCNHTGRTPPCTQAILRAGVTRVVAATADPNPRVPGGGLERLRAGGVDVVLGCREPEARALNRVFLTAMTRHRPHVTLKCAMTLDGKIAAFDRMSRWITGDEARRAAHRLRSEADAIVVGIGTVLADDPELSVRLETPWPRVPLRVVVDSRARLPLAARLIGAGPRGEALVAITKAAPPARVHALEAQGVRILRCRDRAGRVDLGDLAGQLLALDVLGILLEGGSELNWGFLEAGLVDRVALFLAPRLLGGASAPTAVGGAGFKLGAGPRLAGVEVQAVGADWLVEGDVARDEGEG